MFDAATLILFITSAILLAFSPGPDNLFVLTISIARGAAAGVVTTLGLCTGLVVHTSAVVLGVAVVIQESALAFTMLKVAGALYLLWLAWKAFRAPTESVVANRNHETFKQLYLRGILMNIMNPKVALFFLAFLPQFVRTDAGSVAWQICVYGLLFMLSALLVFSLNSFSAGWLGSRFRSGSSQRLLNRLSGVVFAGLAIRLLLAER